MGRAVLLVVALSAFGIALTRHGSGDAKTLAAERAGADQRYVLAERGAGGGLSAAISRLSRGYDWRSGYPTTTAGELSFEVATDGPEAGPVLLTALGTYGDARHQAEAVVSRLADSPAALVLDADTAAFSLSGSTWVISGADAAAQTWLNPATPAEGSGYGASQHAVRTRTADLHDALLAALGSSQDDLVRGLAAASDVVVAESPELVALGEAAVDAAEDAHSLLTPRVYSGGLVASPGDTFGSVADPVAIHVDGDFFATAGSVTGHGVLVVDGDFTAGSQFEWHGLVVVRGENGLDVSLSGQAAVYGAFHVLHETGYALGDGFYPHKSMWNVSDHDAKLLYFVAGRDSVSVYEEGTLQGMTLDTGTDLVDVEGMAFMPDGTLYIVNNKAIERRIYTISADQFDGDPDTPVQATPVGLTGRNTDQDEVTGLVVKNGVLYGLGRRNQEVYQIDMATGAASTIRTFATPSGTGEFLVGGLSLGPNGDVYTSRLRPDDNLELWRFDSFPTGDPVLVSAHGYRAPTTSRMGAAMTIAPDGTLFFHERTELREGTSEGGYESVLSFPADIDAMEMFWEGEGGNSNGPTPSLDVIPWHSGQGTHTASVPWGSGPDVAITTTFSALSGTPVASGWYGRGSTFQEMRATADLAGASVTAGAADLQYTGPTPLPIYRLRAGGVDAGTTEFSVQLDFAESWTGPFYLYVMDLDFHPLTISARNAAGLPLSTAPWTKDTDMDVLGAADIDPYTWSPDGAWTNTSGVVGAGQLEPSALMAEKELSFIGIRIPDPSVRSITLSGTSPDDWVDQVGITVSQEPLFAPPGDDLRFSMSGSARIIHSAEAIGMAAASVTAIETMSYVIERDRFGRDLPSPTPTSSASAGPPSEATDPTDG